MRTVVIMGAGGRDFHDFNTVFRNDLGHPGGRLHRHPDPRDRRSHLPAGAGRELLPQRHPYPA